MFFRNEYVDCTADVDPESSIVTLTGNITAPHQDAEIFAANPIDRMTNYSGSGLPFPCARIAFDMTPNYHHISNGAFSVKFRYPNSYYTEDQYQRIMPSVFFRIISPGTPEPVLIRFELPNPDVLNVRTLTYRTKPRQGPRAYSAKEDEIPICGAEETMRRYRDIKIYRDLA